MKKLYILFILSIASINNSFAQIELWGMIQGGSAYGGGNIFKTDTSGNGFSVVKDFYTTDALYPEYTKLLAAPDGKLYGMSFNGGAHGRGVIFQYDPATSVYIKKFDFDGVANGSSASGSLMLAFDGKMYGMTTYGGINNMGTIFQYDYVTNTLIKKLDFDGTTRGSGPFGSLMQASDGKLYGMTRIGGANSKGVIFQYDPVADTYVKKLDFNGAINGANPYGDLMQAVDGKLYGMTYSGGTYSVGVLFSYDPATNIYTKKQDLITGGGGYGFNPSGSLIQATDGMLYGLMQNGGTNGKGTLFQYAISTNTLTVKRHFTVALAADGEQPKGSLIQASDGNLYGMTYSGGSGGGNNGVIFKYVPSTSIYSIMFNGFGGATTGKNPEGSLVQASDGKLYGLARLGGTNNSGVLFQYDFNTNTYLKKLNLGGDNPDGSSPYGSLMKASNGKLYGMTKIGGLNNQGVIFEYDPAINSYTKKFDFWDGYGYYPYGSLIQATDGKLYGMTSAGGLTGGSKGVIFQYNPAIGSYTVKVDFNGTNGANPYGDLVQATDGKLYGLTSQGGANNVGVLFQYDPVSGVYVKKLDFNLATNGGGPSGSLIQATDGKLYGATVGGGANSKGVIFQYDPVSGIYTKKFDFDGTLYGSDVEGSLMQASDGKLYGTTYTGGVNNGGVLFQFDPVSNIFTKKVDFAITNGGQGTLVQASDGKLYGTTIVGGVNSKGVLFQYDPSISTYAKKYDFDGVHGLQPQFNRLLEMVGSVVTGISPASSFAIGNLFSITPNPANDKLMIRFNGQTFSEVNIRIMDVIGKEVLNDRMNESQTKTILLDNFRPGLYFIEIQSGKDRVVKKFIKE